MKKYKIQNRSQKNSHSCVPLREIREPVKKMLIIKDGEGESIRLFVNYV